MNEAADILGKIKLQKQENDDLNANIQRLANEEKILQEKLERLERQNQEKIDEYDDKKKSLENIKPSSNKDNENNAERREKELDDWLRGKLLELIFGSERKDKAGQDIEKSLNKIMIIGSVMIRYLPNVEDGDTEAFEKTDPLEGYFKVNKKTTFQELKETACEFWKIEDPHLIGLRSSNYALLDLHMGKLVEETILNLRMAPEFWLFKINKFSKKTFTELKDCFVDSSTFVLFDHTEVNKRSQNAGGGFGEGTHKKNFDKIRGVYKGLEKYAKKPVKLSDSEIEKRKLTGYQLNFNACLVNFIILFITVGLLVTRRSVSDDFYIQASLNTDLVKGPNGISFFKIENLDDIHDYMNNSFGPAVFSKEPSLSSINKRYHIIGPVRIRQVKTKEVKCKKKSSWNIEGVSCYGADYLTEKYKEDLESSDNKSSYIKYKSSTSAPDLIVGDVSSYDSSGYVLDIESNSTLNDFHDIYNEMLDINWLDRRTRALFVNFNIYLPNPKQFVAVFIMIEISVNGVCRPSKLESRVLVSDFYSGSGLDKGTMAVEIIRLLLSFYLIFIYIKCGLELKFDGTRSPYTWLKLNNLSNLLIFVLIVTAFAMSLKVNKDAKEIVSSESYYDMGDLFYYFTTSLLLNAWLLLIVFLRVIITFRFSHTLSLNLYALDLASKNFIYYFCFILPIIVCLSVVTNHILGAYTYDYCTPKLVAISNVLFTMGSGDVMEYLKITEAWTIGFLIMYFFIVIFFLYSSFIAILLDSFRISDLYHQELKKSIDNDKDYVPWKIWLFYDCRRCKRKKEEVIENSA